LGVKPAKTLPAALLALPVEQDSDEGG
jgi:hypothetical protein